MLPSKALFVGLNDTAPASNHKRCNNDYLDFDWTHDDDRRSFLESWRERANVHTCSRAKYLKGEKKSV